MQSTQDEANQLDSKDSLSSFRKSFHIPTTKGVEDVYFVGNSLGLQPRSVHDYLSEELEQWKTRGVHGHFEGPLPWMSYQDAVAPMMAELVGALRHEVVVMNTLTINLHLMMATFYQPTNARHKILMESHAFPSDRHAVESHLRLRGRTAEESLLIVAPEPGEALISTDKICDTIYAHRDALAMVLLPGVQYYTGQVFDMQAITSAAKECGVPIGFDLAHAAGNVPLQLHDWGVDFACWCTYKYLNSGPGALSGCFIHERHARNTELPRLAGWWGHDRETLFEMKPEFTAIASAEGWQVSNPPILALAGVRASMELFRKAGGITPLREKSLELNRFFRRCLDETLGDRVRVITPTDPQFAGCQLSLDVQADEVTGKEVFQRLSSACMHTDWREPCVIRAAPAPLYNSFHDVWRFVAALADCTR